MTIRPKSALLDPALIRPSALDSVPRIPGLIWLDKNENLDPELTRLANDLLVELPEMVLSTYPEAGECYRKLADWAGVSPHSLLLTPGSDGAIRLVFEAFVNPGDQVVFTDPTFAMYSVYCQMFGAKQIPIEYTRENDEPYLDPEKILGALNEHQPKLLCLPNPDSPTGTVLEPKILQKILSTCEKTGTVFLVDEAYHPFYKNSVISWTEKSENLIVARTFAKAWGLAGLRIGYAAANPETASLIHKLRPMYEVSTLAVEMISRMLDYKGEMESSVVRMQSAKVQFSDEMKSQGFKVLSTHGNFIHVAFSEHEECIHDFLKDKVYYRKSFHQTCLQGYTRFSIGSQDVMSEVAEFIKSAVKEKINGND
jgi:histidinol-phosphate aminotransferase